MKLRNKLLLSCVALAACATTMVSTTFAWYTSNTEVKADGVGGTSLAQTGDSLLLISDKTDAKSFGSSVTLSLQSDTTQLLPVQYNHSDQSFKKLGGSDTNNATGSSSTTDYISFDLYFKGNKDGAGVGVYLKEFDIVGGSQTPATHTKSMLTGTGMGTNHSAATYSADILRTLNFAYTVDGTGTESTGKGWYDPENLLTLREDTLAGGFDAVSYFNEVTGRTLVRPSESDKTVIESGSTAINLGTTPAVLSDENYLHVKFYVFINGWDQACFDAVQGQDFTITLKFSSEASTKVTKASHV